MASWDLGTQSVVVSSRFISIFMGTEDFIFSFGNGYINDVMRVVIFDVIIQV